MKFSISKSSFVGITVFLFCSPANSQSNVLIEGFAQWQADRVERIALDQAVFGMMENEYVKTFFPQTIEAVDSYGGGTSAQRLIPLIQTTIEHDITDIETTFTECIKLYVNNVKVNLESGDTQGINTALNDLKSFNAELNNVRNSNTAHKSLPILYRNFKSWVCSDKDENQIAAIEQQEIEPVKKQNLKLPDGTSKSDINPTAQAALMEFPRFESVSNQAAFDEAISLINSMLSIINQYEKYRKESPSSKNSVIAIHFFVRFFELFGSNDQNYTQFKSLGLFLASLIEAQKPEDVAAVLDTFIDDQEAYRNKRLDANTALYSWFTLPSYDANQEKITTKKYTGYCLVYGCQNTLFLGSYFGASIVKLPDEETLEEEIQIRAFGPVGLEYKILSVYGRPITVNLAPLDIGNYVSNELQDVEYTARFSDIVAPSIFLSYSMKDRPFSFLAGYQKDVKIGNNIEENTFFISFAFDLPIFTIY